METKGKYILNYFLNKEPLELMVIVELKQIEGFYKDKQNLWYGEVIVNDRPYTEDLSGCVDAKLTAESIGCKLRDELKEKAKKEDLKLKIKKEIVK